MAGRQCLYGFGETNLRCGRNTTRIAALRRLSSDNARRRQGLRRADVLHALSTFAGKSSPSRVQNLSNTSMMLQSRRDHHLHFTATTSTINRASSTASEMPTFDEKKTAKLHDFCLGIPYSFLFFVLSIAASAMNIYAVIWMPVQRWMSVPWCMLMMDNMWVDCIVTFGLLAINVLALRTWKRDNSQELLTLQNNDYSNDKKLAFSPFTALSLFAAVLLAGRSIMRFYLYRIINVSFGPGGKLWLGGGILIHILMSTFFVYNIAAGGNPKKTKEI